MLKLLVPFAVLLAAIGVTVLTDRPQRPADFTFVNRGDVTTLDPQKMSWLQDLRLGRMLFEGLTRNDVFSADYRKLPGVAERWEISPDARTYTFFLRPDAKWSNGEPVTAEDFVYSWRRALLPDTACDFTGMLQKIQGAKAFYDWRQEQLGAFAPAPGDDDGGRPLAETAAGRLWERTCRKFDELVAMKALDSRTLRIELDRPTPYFLDLCSFAVFYPVYPPLVSRYEPPDRRTGRLDIQSGWTKPPLLVSNGPFKLTQWRFRRELRVEKNPHYWDRASLAIDSAAVPTIEDPNAVVLSYRSGGIDWVSEVAAPYRADILAEKMQFYKEHQQEYDALAAQGLDPIEIDRRLPSDRRNHIRPCPAFGTYFFNFNCSPRLRDGRENPFANAKIRKAFALAVDKKRIVEQVRRVGEQVALTVVPPGSIGGYQSPKGLAYNPEEARRLLAEAGYPDGKGFITVEILFNKDGGHDLVAQSMAKDWEQNLGISIVLSTREISVFKEDLKNQNYMIGRAGWFGDYGDPTTFLDLNRKGDGNNDRKYHSPRYEALLDQAESEVDPAARMRLLHEAERIIVEEDFPLIPLYHYVQMYMFDPHKLSGISYHPRQEQNLYLIDVLGDGKGSDVPRGTPAGRGAGEK